MDLTESGEHGGIEAIGFGAASGTSGKIAGLLGIDDGERDAGGVESGHHGAFPATGGRADDVAGHFHLAQKSDQSSAARWVVSEEFGLSTSVEIEGVFGDIQSEVDGRRVHR
jgi:hypothetical protein